MHDHPLDLIAALADGSSGDEAEARALIESCEVCRAEYQAQTEVIAWLAAAPAVEMTDSERATLHRDLWTELRRQPAKGSGMPWWQRLSYVAAGLFVTVGLVGVLNSGLLGGGAESAATTTAGAQAFDESPTEEVPFVTQGSDDGEAAPEMATETTAATAGEDSLALPFEELADETRARQNDRVATETTDADFEECLTRVGLDDHVVVDEVDLDQTYLLVMRKDPEAEPVVTFIVIPTCEIVYVG
ncbi:MAG TPA: hypothetical protein VHM29_10000 [Acidimicrobiia bacterium]|jgi:hypothetical protein|nr:hypothetical protein [Acidimicrobiia bacterium]